MYRATTPKHTFVFDVDPSDAFEKVLITYWQDGQIVLEKGLEDLTVEIGTGCDGERVYEASLTLTQEEANSFSSKSSARVQVRGLTYSGEAVASKKMTIPVNDVLNDEVLV